jgi:hypothetical protein
MKKIIFVLAGVILFHIANGQAFRKGSLLVSISEGGTYTNYATNNGNDVVKQGNINGDRDPITVEYGLSKHWGVGLNIGGDVLNVNPSSYYSFETPRNKVKVITSEVTADAHYHYFVTKHTDLSAFVSLGLAGVTIKGNDGDSHYQYNASGGIVRVGTEARYYVCKRFGFLAMVSVYSSNCSTKDIKDNTVGNGISTTIKGFAWELGLCYRFF